MALNFNSVVNGFKNNLQGNLSVASVICSSQPIATLRESMLKYKTFIQGRLTFCEDATTTMLSVARDMPSDAFDLNYVGSVNLQDDVAQLLLNMVLSATNGEYPSGAPFYRPQNSWCFTLPSGHKFGIIAQYLSYMRSVSLTLVQFETAIPNVSDNKHETIGYIPIDPNDSTHKTVLSRDGEAPSISIEAWKRLLPNFSLYDLSASLVDMSNCNDYIVKVIDVFSNSATNSFSVLQSLQASIKDNLVGKASYVWNTAKSFVDHVIQGYVNGGIKGAMMAILDWANAGRSLVNTSDHGMEFSVNQDIVPASYVFGVLGVVAATASTILGLIVSFFSRILGAVLTAIGSTLWAAIGSFKYDESTTRAGINLSQDVDAPWLQLSLMKIQIPITSSIQQSFLYFLLANGTGITRLQVPFGYLMCGKYSDDQGIDYLRVEFHPDYLDRRSAMRKFGDDYFEFYTTFDQGTTFFHSTFDQVGMDLTTEQLLQRLWEADGQAQDYGFANETDQTTGVFRLSDNNDFHMKDIVMTNIGGFILYTALSAVKERDQILGNVLVGTNIFNGKIIGKTNEPHVGNFWVPGYFGYPAHYFLDCWESFVVYAIYGPRNGHGEHWNDPIISAALVPFPTWTEIITQLDNYSSASLASKVPNVGIDRSRMYGEAIFFEMWCCKDLSLANEDPESYSLRFGEYVPVTVTTQYAVYMPAYDSKSFWSNLAVTLVVAALVAATVVIASVAVKKTMRKIQAKQAMEVERAWSQYTDDEHPHTDAERKAFQKQYFKAVRKANFLAGITGGTKYDYAGFWNGDPTSTATEQDGEVAANTSVISMIGDNYLTSDGKLNAGSVGYGEYSMNQLYKDITGREWATAPDPDD